MTNLEIKSEVVKSETQRLTEEMKISRKECSYTDSINKNLNTSIVYLESLSRWIVCGLLINIVMILVNECAPSINSTTSNTLFMTFIVQGIFLVINYIVVNCFYNDKVLTILETTSLNIKELELAEKLSFKAKTLLSKGHKGIFLNYVGIFICSLSVGISVATRFFIQETNIKHWIEYGIISSCILSIIPSFYGIAAIISFNRGKAL